MISKFLYIDPGTGSMLFSIIIGITGVLVFAARALFIKFKFFISGGRRKADDKDLYPICIFSEGKRYWSVFRPICDEFEKRQRDIWYLTGSPDDPALSSDYKFVHSQFIGEGNKAISRMNLIKAKVVLSTTPSLDVFQWKRSKTAKWYVHIPHAASDITLYKMFGLDFYDAVLLSGQYQIDQIKRLETARGISHKELKLAGIPYMDKMNERLKASNRTTVNKEPVILLAPSWGTNGILSVYGSSFIDLLINTEYKIIIRPHPQSFTSEKILMDELMSKYPESDKLKWNRDPDNFAVLNEADLLISDFSGVLFDFSLVFNKPIIYTEPVFDKSEYDCAWDDQELWTYDILPKIGRLLNNDNFENIGQLIQNCLEGSDAEELSKGRDIARKQTWCNIGHGAEKVANYILAKYDAIVKEESQAAEQLNTQSPLSKKLTLTKRPKKN